MSHAPNSMAARDVAYAMHPYTNLALHEERGLIVRGLPGDAVAACPPLIIEETQIDELFDEFERGLDDAAKVLGA